MRSAGAEERIIVYMGSVQKDINAFPQDVRDEILEDIQLIQRGETPEDASPFEGSIAGNMMKLVKPGDKVTYRVVYAAKFERAIYVLHGFVKKAHHGIRSSREDIETARRRYVAAKQHYDQMFGEEKQSKLARKSKKR
jgi:phage-related protein